MKVILKFQTFISIKKRVKVKVNQITIIPLANIENYSLRCPKSHTVKDILIFGVVLLNELNNFLHTFYIMLYHLYQKCITITNNKKFGSYLNHEGRYFSIDIDTARKHTKGVYFLLLFFSSEATL